MFSFGVFFNFNLIRLKEVFTEMLNIHTKAFEGVNWIKVEITFLFVGSKSQVKLKEVSKKA
jgi:hypothetical protein